MGHPSHSADCGSLNDALRLPIICEPDPSSQTLVAPKNSIKLLDRKRVLGWLSENVPEKRLNHILRVEETAIKLAEYHNLDWERAAQAGLLHDLAKYFKPKRLLEIAKADGIKLDPVDEINPHLLHADVGAIVARDEFGVVDTEVLAAIYNHTLGRPGMSLISCVVFLADGMEPGRGDTTELNEIRKLSRKNLHRAVLQICEDSMRSLFASRSLIHPRVLQTRNWALQMAQQSAKGDKPKLSSA
ncbi:bis(5'-nucleosyl)-tetraphosphatase (symmetrical) YqeK [Phormidium sp. CLA17]|uniref:bis(5'-nucleosyl)-tetraphosphatase (symmetrical) YqeK n=1 Tax=Leptolyngbya sp. Cla-17 TaxID=2803751 RepID=UPI001492FA02|nr:bis(5'-nucleosyl)-tetraphosphatase (symmetrical) YqeK [Leptolyngbya sp. Cla-17]MBM0742205.1 bis(5'-nucleosyl)-tetraphosphatase (symmetrical) YqeK [Leptolyngbya sp. Cla-17]